METLRRFFRDVKKYREYIANSVNTELTTEYTNSYIGYLWWILDPLLYMLIYVFVVSIVLRRGYPDYPVFLFTGLLFWRWVQSSLTRSTGSIISKRRILNQTYIPKFVFPLIRTGVETAYFLFSVLVLMVFLVAYRTPFTWHLFETVPLIIVSYLFILGLSLWLAHLGVYFYDMDRVLHFLLRMWYYLSPGLYRLSDVPDPYRAFFWLNPLTTILESSRNIFLHGAAPIYSGILTLGAASLVLIVFGLRQLYKFDRMYAKVI